MPRRCYQNSVAGMENVPSGTAPSIAQLYPRCESSLGSPVELISDVIQWLELHTRA
jgi:hypothetical protein